MPHYLITSFVFIFLIGCNLDVNTTDPQASSTIDQSIKNGFFIKEYSVTSIPDSLFTIEKAWAEYTWKNEIEGGKVSKKRMNSVQLILSTKKSNNSVYSKANYLINWEMQEPLYGYFGRDNEVFVLRLKEISLPDTLSVNVNLINSTTKSSNQFKIYKK